jgi:hypothetical protein
MEREIRDHASKGDDKLTGVKAGLRGAEEKLRPLQANVLLEFKIPRQEILGWFR